MADLADHFQQALDRNFMKALYKNLVSRDPTRWPQLPGLYQGEKTSASQILLYVTE